LWVRNIPVEDEECKWTYKRSYIWTAEKDMDVCLIIAVIYTNQAVVKRKLGKNSGLNGIRNHYQTTDQFFSLQFHNCLICVYNCDDQSGLPDYLVTFILSASKVFRRWSLRGSRFGFTCILFSKKMLNQKARNFKEACHNLVHMQAIAWT